MKKLFAALIIVSLIFGVCFVYAEQAVTEQSAGNEALSRLDLCVKLAEVLKPDELKNIMPLLKYNDWATIPVKDRKTVATVIDSGIFIPDGSSFNPNDYLTDQDLDRLAYNLTIYGLSDERLSFVRGTVTGTRKNIMTLYFGGTSHQYDYSNCFFPDGWEITHDTMLDCITDADNNMLVAWASRDNAMSVYSIQKGNLYLFDTTKSRLIINNLKLWVNNRWVSTPNERYITAGISELTRIVADGKVVDPAVLNDLNYLDRDASFIVGIMGEEKYILYLELF